MHRLHALRRRVPRGGDFAEDDVPDDQKPFTALNAELAKLWKPIIERKPAPADADDWKTVKAKRDLLER